jgi:RNA polymerase sigma-70 factor (ECF subfamily)
MHMPPENPQPELALLARMRQGDETAFVALYRRHATRSIRLALLYCGASAQAADVTQETFIHLMTRTDQYDPPRGTLGSWLCGVARNLARKAAGYREDRDDPAMLADDTRSRDHVERDTPLESCCATSRREGARARSRPSRPTTATC